MLQIGLSYINISDTLDEERNVSRRFEESKRNETTQRLSRFSFLIFFNPLKINFNFFLDCHINIFDTVPSDATKPGIDNLLNISEFFETDIYDLLQEVSNVSFSNNKFDKSNIFNHSIQPTFNMHSPEVLESILSNQEKITLLIESQNKLITTLLENKK